MPFLRNSLVLALLALTACYAAPAAEAPGDAAPKGKLGLMSSLPLYWPVSADLGAVANGSAGVPWQREALERDFALEPLDTLAPIPAASPDAPPTDPLKGLTRLAIIQPRGLSPADNVALDDWVRAGGHLLLVLDPMLSGEYDLPIGDPRRPVDTAVIPPVVARWGMKVSFAIHESEEGYHTSATMPGGGVLPRAYPGTVDLVPSPAAGECSLHEGTVARCKVGKGKVTLIADAAIFEHPDLAGEGAAILRAVVREALD